MCFRNTQRVHAVTRFEHQVAVAAEHFARERPHRVLVFDEQDRLPSRRGRRIAGRRRRDCTRPGRRQVDLERGAVPGLAVDPDVTAALLDHAVDRRQAKAAAFALLLGREERLEHARTGRRVHAFAAVADREHHVRARLDRDVRQRVRGVQFDVGSLDRQPPAGRHRIARVDREVDENLLHRRRIDRHLTQIGRERGDQLDILADQPAQQFLDLRHQRVEVDHLRLQHLPPAERQQLPGQRRGAIARRLNFQQIQAQRILLRDLVEHQVAVAEDRREQVVEVVRDPAGELTDRFHLLRLAQLLLELAPLGDVARVDDDGADGGVAEAVDADPFHDPPRAVGVMEPDFFHDRRAGFADGLGQAHADELAILRVQEIEDRSSHHLLRRPSEMADRRGAEIRDAPLGVDQQQRVGAVLDQRAEALFAGAQRRLGVPALHFLGVQRERVADGALQALDGQVHLAEIIGGAGLHRLDGDVLRAAAGQHDDRRRDALVTDLAQQAQAVAGAEQVVEEGDVERLFLEGRERLVVAGRDADARVRPRVGRSDELLHHPRMLGRIVDNEEAERLGHRSGRRATFGGRCPRSYRQARGTIPRLRARRAASASRDGSGTTRSAPCRLP